MEYNSGYNTKQKNFILNCLNKHDKKHYTVDDIYELLKNEGTAVGKTTIYRYLERLVSEGLVHKYITENGESACFQYIGKNEHCTEYFHLKCSDCGKLIHLECSHIDELEKHILNRHQFHIDNFKTIFYGRCEKCSHK